MSGTHEDKVSEVAIHPFYIYDQRKSHGYIYYPRDRLYHFSDRHTLKRYCIDSSAIPEFIRKDLRGIMDGSSDIIPIAPGRILIPSTGKIRDRNETDYFTYELQAPTDFNRIQRFIEKMVPNECQRELLQKFLQLALIRYAPDIFVVIRGPAKAVEQLFNLLSTLDPIIKTGRISLYCETNVSKIVLDEVHKTRIVLCNLKDRTIRCAQPPINKPYERQIQYHGLIAQERSIQEPSTEVKEHTIQINSVNADESFMGGEVLGWILDLKLDSIQSHALKEQI